MLQLSCSVPPAPPCYVNQQVVKPVSLKDVHSAERSNKCTKHTFILFFVCVLFFFLCGKSSSSVTSSDWSTTSTYSTINISTHLTTSSILFPSFDVCHSSVVVTGHPLMSRSMRRVWCDDDHDQHPYSTPSHLGTKPSSVSFCILFCCCVTRVRPLHHPHRCSCRCVLLVFLRCICRQLGDRHPPRWRKHMSASAASLLRVCVSKKRGQ